DPSIAANIARGFCPKKRPAAVVPSGRVSRKLWTAVRQARFLGWSSPRSCWFRNRMRRLSPARRQPWASPLPRRARVVHLMVTLGWEGESEDNRRWRRQEHGYQRSDVDPEAIGRLHLKAAQMEGRGIFLGHEVLQEPCLIGGHCLRGLGRHGDPALLVEDINVDLGRR